MDLKNKIIDDIKKRKLRRLASGAPVANRMPAANADGKGRSVSGERFREFSQFKDVELHRLAAAKLELNSPFFKVHEGLSSDTSVIDGRSMLNFSSYDYLGINGDSRQIKAARDALERYGVSSSASRLVSGERPVQLELEERLAQLHGVESAVVFVSGHATNASTIGNLFGAGDLLLHDSLIHNSVIEGAKLSGAKRLGFAHNDFDALEKLLKEQRAKYQRVLIVVEGLYSMDGDYPDLPRLLEIKEAHDAFLMVDEAHSVGVMGETGRGLAEFFSIDPGRVDIWMGTLSKAFASTGGYIAGSFELVDIIKNQIPGFVYSVGLPPVLAASAVAAIDIMLAEPERVRKLQSNGKLFDELAKGRGLDTGRNRQFAVIPIMTKGSIPAVRAANYLAELGVNVQPIIHPAVEERLARLRFFICASHSENQIEQAIEHLSVVMRKI